MPRIDVIALQRVMMTKNFLFKHQLANAVGLSYEHLTGILSRNENEVEEDVVAKLCAGLGCKRSDIVSNE